MIGQDRTHPSGIATGVIALLWVLGGGVGSLAVVSGTSSLWRIADLFFDLSLLVTMVTRGASLLGPYTER